MFSFRIGKVTFDFTLLIIVFAVSFAVLAIHSIVLVSRSNRSIKFCKTGEYDKAITLAKKARKTCAKYCRRSGFSKKSTKRYVDWIYKLDLVIAISYFAQDNTDEFLCTLNQLNDNLCDKHYLLALHYLLKDKPDDANIHYQRFIKCDHYPFIKDFLDGIILYKENKISEAQSKLREVYPKLSYEYSKNIAKSFMN